MGRRCELVLPYPPSLWSLYRGNGKNRQRSPIYNAWLNTATLHHANAPVNMGPCEVRIVATETHDHRMRDVDNLPKPICDWLKKSAILKDDSDIRKLTVEWGDVDLSRLLIEAPRAIRVEIEAC